MATESATLGGGCFWCLEAVFQRLRGVESVLPGYAGGEMTSPTYEMVCSGRTGHAEVIQVQFDPAVLSYPELLEVFFAFHDPTTLNQQGPDVGTQYRSVILTDTPAQEAAAKVAIARLESDKTFDDPIVTEVRPLERFWPAEAYHLSYYDRNPNKGYCAVMIAPKVAKLRLKWSSKLKPDAA